MSLSKHSHVHVYVLIMSLSKHSHVHVYVQVIAYIIILCNMNFVIFDHVTYMCVCQYF